MAETKTVIIGAIEQEITNGCICESYDEDTDTYSPTDYCYGCFDDEKSNLDYEIVKPWLSMNDLDENDYVRVDGSNVGWTHASGYGYIKANTESLIDFLNIRTEWTLRFKLDNGKLSVVRSSHDESGAYFEFRKATEQEIEDFVY
jgi:hypothetical protein